MKFLFGKVFTGLVGLIVFLMIARELPEAQFGAYVAFLALQASLTVFSTLGLDAATERYLPELKTFGLGEAVNNLLLISIALRFCILLIVAVIAYLASGYWLPWLGLAPYAGLIHGVLAWIVLYGALQTAIAMLEALLRQGAAQRVQAVYVLLKLGLLGWVIYTASQPAELGQLIWIEVVSAALALAAALHYLKVFVTVKAVLSQQRSLVSGFPAGIGARLRRFAALNYSAQLAMLSYGADYARFLLSALVGLAATARFGFVYSLYDYVQRYLPANLLIRLIRPVFIARYAADKDFSQLNAFANIILKLNLLVLAPMAVMLMSMGNVLVDLMSKGKYADTHGLLMVYILLLVPMSHQWVISIIANTLEMNFLQLRGAVLAAVGGLVAYALVGRLGVWACAAGAWLSALIYNAHAIYCLRRAGFAYRLDLRAAAKFLAAGLVGAAVVSAGLQWDASTPMRVTYALAGGAATLAALLLIKPFSEHERALLNKVLPKPVFMF